MALNSHTNKLIMFLLIVLMAGFSIVAHATNFETADAQFQELRSDQDKMAWVLKYEPEAKQWPAIDQAYFHHRKGLTLEVNNDIEGAKDQFNQSILLFKSIDEIDAGLVQSLIDLSYMKYLQTNDTSVYCPEREEAVETARKIDNAESLAGALIQLAFCFQSGFDDLSQGLAVLDEAAEVVKSNNLSHTKLAMIYNATANLYRANQVHEQAFNYYEKAYHLWLGTEDTQDIFNMLHNMFSEANELGHWQDAESHVNGLFALAEKHPELTGFKFFAEFNAGRLAFAQQDFGKAVEAFEAALALKETTPEVYFVKIAESQLAIAYFRLQQFDQAFLAADSYLADMADINNFNTTAQEAVIIQLYAQQKTEQALEKFWQVLDKSRANNRLFVKNAVALQALEFGETVDKLQNQASQHQLSINQLQLKQQQKQTRINYLTAVVIGLFALVTIIFAWFLYRSKKHYQIRAQTDYLTHIANRRHIIEKGRRLLTQCEQRQEDFSIIIIDIDDFKLINDKYGHAIGDVVIKQVVNSMRNGLSEGQILGRIGGEEFLMLLPKVNKGHGYVIAERIRKHVADTLISVDKLQLQITLSLGVAVNKPPVTVFEELLRRADEAMYQAKIAGKNQVQPAWSVSASR